MSATWAEVYGVQEHQEDEESSEEVAGKSPHEEQCDEDQAFDSKFAHALIFFFGRSNIMPALQNEIDAASRLMQENDLKFFYAFVDRSWKDEVNQLRASSFRRDANVMVDRVGGTFNALLYEGRHRTLAA
jgi:hypothetical protein